MSERVIHPRVLECYADARRQSEAAEAFTPLSVLESRAETRSYNEYQGIETAPPSFYDAIEDEDGVSIIAEHKRKSPSEGDIRPNSEVVNQTLKYQKGGAAAVSILTQQESFGGTIHDIRQARSVLDVPILRKDFISLPHQLFEADDAGASAALLIMDGPFSTSELAELFYVAKNIGIEPLAEIRDERGLNLALALGAKAVGINNRDLGTLEVDLDRFDTLVDKVPRDIVVVAESGYRFDDPEHIERLKGNRKVGESDRPADAVLIGTAAMRSANPVAYLQHARARLCVPGIEMQAASISH